MSPKYNATQNKANDFEINDFWFSKWMELIEKVIQLNIRVFHLESDFTGCAVHCKKDCDFNGKKLKMQH